MLTILGSEIHQDTEGRFSLNDLHKSSGGKESHRPTFFLRLKEVERMVELLNIRNLKRDDSHALAISRKTGRNGGTWICRQLVYKYAMWVSGEFELSVIETFDQASRGSFDNLERQPLETMNAAIKRHDAGKRNASIGGGHMARWRKINRDEGDIIKGCIRLIQHEFDFDD